MSTNDIIINRELLFKRYMEIVNSIADECDWVTNISPQTLVNIVADIIENEKNVIHGHK